MTQLAWRRQSDGARSINAARRRREPGLAWELHSHDYVELMVIEHGRVEHLHEDTVEILRPGDVICLVPGEVHQGRVPGPEPLVFLNLSFARQAAAALVRRYPERRPWPWQGGRPARRWLLAPAQVAFLAGLLPVADVTSAAGRDLLLLALVETLHAAAPPAAEAALPLPLRHGLLDLLASDGERMGVREWARCCRCSREHLNRVCRRLTGHSATGLLVGFRTRQAAEALRRSDARIDVIARRHGFASPGSFYAALRRRHGCTPRQWRQAGAG